MVLNTNPWRDSLFNFSNIGKNTKQIVNFITLSMKSLVISTSQQEKVIQNETERRRTLRLLQVCSKPLIVHIY